MNLSELINWVKERDQITNRGLMDRARRRGAPVPTALHHFANPQWTMQDMPRTKTIYGLAVALGVSPEEVAAAALESLGLDRRDIVEIHADRVFVYTESDDRDVVAYPEAPSAWRILVIPDADTPSDVLDGIRTGAHHLRLGVETPAPAET